MRRLGGRDGLIRRWRRSVSGTTAIEMAIVLPVFLAMVMGIIEFGRLDAHRRRACRRW